MGTFQSLSDWHGVMRIAVFVYGALVIPALYFITRSVAKRKGWSPSRERVASVVVLFLAVLPTVAIGWWYVSNGSLDMRGDARRVPINAASSLVIAGLMLAHAFGYALPEKKRSL